MDNFFFECLWGKDADETREAVKVMWRTYHAIDTEAQLKERGSEIVFVVANAKGEVGGVSTVRPIQAKFLNNHFFYAFRCFLSPDFRVPGLDSLLALKTKRFLELQEGSGSKFKGILMIIENAEIKNQRTKAVWPATETLFAGYTARGHHIRVGYFKGARI